MNLLRNWTLSEFFRAFNTAKLVTFPFKRDPRRLSDLTETVKRSKFTNFHGSGKYAGDDSFDKILTCLKMYPALEETNQF